MSEDQHTEWKASWRDEHLKWLCAFANAQGGILEIGRNDKGQAVGLDNAERLIKELPNKLRNLLGMAPDNGSSGTSEATTQERILALLRENPEITRKALADRIGITLAGVKYHLANLRQAGRIRHVGSARKGHWEVMDDTH